MGWKNIRNYYEYKEKVGQAELVEEGDKNSKIIIFHSIIQIILNNNLFMQL
ncbi:MAG: hypothetical protein ACPKPY_11155 [Nitrososphaeraceae archaeon]